jgi:MFS transporter, SHS family, sialic acid transporter
MDVPTLANRKGPRVTEAPASPISRRGQWMALIAAFLGWMFDGFEMGVFGLVARPALRDLLGPGQESHVGHWLGIIIAVFLVGAATGGVLFGWLGDRLGRVKAMTLSVLTYAVFTGLCGLVTSVEQLAVVRFIASLGMGGEWALGVALVMEVWPNRSRAWLAGVIGSAANVGFALIALLGIVLGTFLGEMRQLLSDIGLSTTVVQWLLAFDGWRLLMLCGTLPALLTFLIRLFVPESERWKREQASGATSHWRSRDLGGVLIGAAGACGIIWLWAVDFDWRLRLAGTLLGLVIATLGCLYPVVKYLQRNVQPEEQERYRLSGVLRRMLFGALLSGIPLLGTWGATQWIPSWADKMTETETVEFRDGKPHVVKHTNPTAKGYTQFWSATGAVFGTILAALLGDWVGRRLAYTLLCLGALAVTQSLYWLFSAYDYSFLFMVFWCGFFVGSFYGWIPLYFPELFRTRVRSTAQGFAYNFGRILAAIGTLQTGNLLQVFDGRYPVALSIVSLIYVLGVIVIWFGPETRGQPLPE